MWRRVASGDRSPEVEAWLAAAATEVVQEVFEAKFVHAGRRAEAALRAVGFVGQVDRYEDLRHLVDEVDAGGGYSARVLAQAAPLILEVPDQPKKLQKVIEAHRARRKR
jgi:hypothetical protein